MRLVLFEIGYHPSGNLGPKFDQIYVFAAYIVIDGLSTNSHQPRGGAQLSVTLTCSYLLSESRALL